MTDDLLSRFDEIDGQIRDDMAQRRTQSGLLASDRNPDEYARAGQLAGKLGVSQDLVATNLPDYERQDRDAGFDALSQQHPELQPLAADPRWRTLANDDGPGVGRLATALKSPAKRKRTLLSKSVESLFGPLLTGERGQAFLQNLDDAAETMAVSARGAAASVNEWIAERDREIAAEEDGFDPLATQAENARSVAANQNRIRQAEAARFDLARDAAKARAEAAAIQEQYPDGSPGYHAMGVARSVPVMVAAAVTRNPAVGGTLIGGATAAEQRSSALADGATPGQATASGVVHGTIEGTLDTITLGIARYGLGPVREWLVKRYGASAATRLLTRATANVPARVATATAEGAITEVPTSLAQMASDEIILGADYGTGDYLRAVRDSAIQGGAMSGGLYTATAPLRAFANDDLNRALSSADDLADLQEITAAAAESKLGQRSPEDAAAIAQAIAADERVYLAADDAKVLFQNDPGLLADLVGGDDVLTEQLATGDVSIPMARWVSAVARLPNADEIVRHARLDPDGISAAELERLDAEAEALDTADAADRAEPAGPDARQQIIDDVTGQLLSLDRYTPAQAEAQAKLWGAAFSMFGKRSGQDAFALYQRYMDGIRSGSNRSDPRVVRPFQGSARLEALIESARTGIAPVQSQVFGPSLTQWLASQGGVQDQTGELRSFDAGKLRPGLVNGRGLSLDRARELAVEAGYLSSDSTVADFLDLVDRDLRQGDVRSEQLSNAERVAFEAERQQFVEAFDANPRLRGMPREELAKLTNQQIADELFGSTLDQSAIPPEVEIEQLRARVAALETELRTDRLTGMRNQRAFEEDGALGWETVVAADMDGLKRLNDAIGHEHADTVLRALGGVLLSAEANGVRFYRRSGDEFAARFEDPAAADRVMREIQQRLENVAIDLDVADAAGNIRQLTYEGIGLTYGTGNDYQTADTAANASKRERLAAGIREDARSGGEPRRLQSRAGLESGRGADQGQAPAVERNLFERAVDAVRNLFQSPVKDQTKTPEFKRWFGDSKVVDANGEPLVVYHGTGSQFDAFDRASVGRENMQSIGFHFAGSVDEASGYANRSDAPRVIPAYLKIDNPLTIDSLESASDYVDVNRKAIARRIDDSKNSAAGDDDLLRALGIDPSPKGVQGQAYDGIIVRGADGSSNYIVFEPTQIKSATGNRGTFDPNDPSILNQQPAEKGPRGQISIFPDRRMSISLFENADASTFIHESAHFFFEVYRDLAAMPDADAGLKADFDALLQWVGADSDSSMTVDQLEQIARGFESYVGEGKAPSPELRSVFAKLASWILGVYRALRNLNVELTDDVRGVFDRMLASEDEIEAAQVRQGMVPLVLDTGEASGIGLTEQQFADYQAMVQAATEEARLTAFNRTLSALQRERKAWWKEERAKVREEVDARYEATPAVRALRVLSGRKTVDSVELEAPLLGLKLDRSAIVAGWGDAYLKRLGKTYAKAGGVHPDEAATLLGFASGDDLLRAVANAPDLLARVEAETEAIMRERHGDPMVDGTLPQVAMDAVHGSKRVKLLERELEILGKVTGQPAPNRRMLKAMAERQVAAKTPRQLRPNDYLVAERRAARDAIKAAARGDYADAMLAKRRQAINVSLYRAARDAQEQFERDLNYLRRMTSSERRARLGKAGHDYLEQVDGLLEAVELRPASGAEVNRRARLVEWVHAQEKAGNPVNVPVKLLAEAGLTNLRDMTHEDIRGVVDTIKQIEHLAKTKTRLFLAGQERDRDEVDAEMAGSVLAAHAKIWERTGDPTLLEKARSKITDLDIGRLLPTNVARELDGYEDGGAVWRNVILPIREAMYQRVMPATRKMQEAVAALYAEHYSPDEIRRLSAPVWREKVGDHWSKGRILALAMNWGSDGNRDAILSQARSRLSEQQAVDLLRTLDARDWTLVQGMVDQVNSYWPEIADTQRRRTGLVPEKVEAKPFTITNEAGEVITVRGGYFPLKYDAERSGYGATLNEMEDAYNDMRVGRTAKAATKNGHTIERVGSGGKTVALDFEIAISHMRDVIRDLHLGDAVNYAHNVLHGGDFKDAAVAVGMRQHLTALELWLKDVATGEVGPRNAVESTIRFARQNTTAAVLAYKASSALLQVTGLVQTGSVIGNRAMLRGVTRLLSKSWIGPNSVWSDIREKSPYMRERFGNVVDAVEQVQSMKDGRIKSLHGGMIRLGFVPMARFQMIADAATWLAGEAVGLKKFSGDVEKARAFADDLVIRAQSPDAFIDKSSIGRGTLDTNIRQSEAIKATTMLLSYMIAKGNIAREKYQSTQFTKPADVVKFSADMVQLFAVETVLMALLRNGLPEDEDDDGLGDDWFSYLAKEIALGNLSTVPLLSQLATEGRGYDAQGVMERGWGTLADATGAWFDDEINRKDVRHAINAAGVASGIPSSQINTTSDALWRVHDGEDVSPIDFFVRPEKPRD